MVSDFIPPDLPVSLVLVPEVALDALPEADVSELFPDLALLASSDWAKAIVATRAPAMARASTLVHFLMSCPTS
jgi:hypothetical protein